LNHSGLKTSFIFLFLITLLAVSSLSALAVLVDVQETTVTAGGHWEDVQETTVYASMLTWVDTQITTVTVEGIDPYALDVTDVVWVIVFFIPVMILGDKFGGQGLVGSLALMTIIFMFGMSNFVVAGTLNVIGITVFMYKGGIQK